MFLRLDSCWNIKSFFRLGARRFHFPKYKTCFQNGFFFIFWTWKVTSWSGKSCWTLAKSANLCRFLDVRFQWNAYRCKNYTISISSKNLVRRSKVVFTNIESLPYSIQTGIIYVEISIETLIWFLGISKKKTLFFDTEH